MNSIDRMEAIAKKIGDSVDGVHVYIQNTIQNIKTPCFIIQEVNEINRRLLGTINGQLVRKTTQYAVNFICPDDIKSLRSVTEALKYQLLFIETKEGYPLEPNDIESNYIDDETSVITFSIDSEVVVNKDPSPFLKEMDEEIRIEENERT